MLCVCAQNPKVTENFWQWNIFYGLIAVQVLSTELL